MERSFLYDRAEETECVERYTIFGGSFNLIRPKPLILCVAQIHYMFFLRYRQQDFSIVNATAPFSSKNKTGISTKYRLFTYIINYSSPGSWPSTWFKTSFLYFSLHSGKFGSLGESVGWISFVNKHCFVVACGGKIKPAAIAKCNK